jgi:hypothetical protein
VSGRRANKNMQYPEIQFYRGSLVRLATGQLKHVEDLSSDDFIESAKLAVRSPNGKQTTTTSANAGAVNNSRHSSQEKFQQQQLANMNCNSIAAHQSNRTRFDFNPLATNQFRRQAAGTGHHHHQLAGGMVGGGSSGNLDENNNSVFNSPEPSSSCFDDSPRMKTDNEDDDEEIDVELDVVTTHDDAKSEPFHQRLHVYSLNNNNDTYNQVYQPERGLNLTSRNDNRANNSLQQVKLEPHQLDSSSSAHSSSTTTPFNLGSATKMDTDMSIGSSAGAGQTTDFNLDGQDFYIDSSVVRDFLEVGPIQLQASQGRLPASTSPASSTNSLNNQDHHHNQAYSLPSTSSSSSSNSLQSSVSPPAVMPQILSAAPPNTSQTVLIKFFLETSRTIVFIEVPIEHPFFVFHRGWSSWNPQRTYDKFGLKCRKLKIGDTCISLIRRKQNTNQQDSSDQCNLLFSSIKINE